MRGTELLSEIFTVSNCVCVMENRIRGSFEWEHTQETCSTEQSTLEVCSVHLSQCCFCHVQSSMENLVKSLNFYIGKIKIYCPHIYY